MLHKMFQKAERNIKLDADKCTHTCVVYTNVSLKTG